jgi:hypothetical protein
MSEIEYSLLLQVEPISLISLSPIERANTSEDEDIIHPPKRRVLK